MDAMIRIGDSIAANLRAEAASLNQRFASLCPLSLSVRYEHDEPAGGKQARQVTLIPVVLSDAYI